MSSLGSTSWRDLTARAEPPVVVVPIGSCEQHGPHLPLDTDTRIAVHLADALAVARDDVVVAPAIPFGASWEHAGFPGLLSLNHEVLASIIVELAHSADWANGLLFLNGHGGNLTALQAAVRRVTAEGRRAMAWSPRLPDGDPHAGKTETSIMLAIAPTLVQMTAAVPGWSGRMDGVFRDGVRSVSPNGVLGDPTAATATHGHEVVAQLTSDLVAAFDRWQA